MFTPRVDRYGQIPARTNRRSASIRLISKQVRAVPHACHPVVHKPERGSGPARTPGRQGTVRLDLDHCPEGPGLQSRRLPRLRSLEQARQAGRFTPVHDTWWAQAKKIHRERDGTRTLIEMLLLGRHLALEHVVAGLATDTAALARAKAGRPRPPPHLKERADAVREKSTPRGRNAVSAGSALAAREALCAGEALRTRGGVVHGRDAVGGRRLCAGEVSYRAAHRGRPQARAQPAPAGPPGPSSGQALQGHGEFRGQTAADTPRPPGPRGARRRDCGMHDAHTRPANTTTERCNSQARIRGPTGGTRDTGNSTAATRTAQQ